MAYFKQGGDRKGGQRFGGDSRRPSFNKKSWGDDRGRQEMHKAVCANCGKSCEVPFRPAPGKQVFCKDCFGRNEGRSGGQDRNDGFQRRDFRPAHDTRTSAPADRGSEDLKRQLEALNAKVDRLVQAVEAIAYAKPASLKEAVADATETKTKPKKAIKKKK